MVHNINDDTCKERVFSVKSKLNALEELNKIKSLKSLLNQWARHLQWLKRSKHLEEMHFQL